MSQSDSLPQIKPTGTDAKGAKLADPLISLSHFDANISVDYSAFEEKLECKAFEKALKSNAWVYRIPIRANKQ